MNITIRSLRSCLFSIISYICNSKYNNQVLSMKRKIVLFILIFVSLYLNAIDNIRISDIRSMGMGINGVTQSILYNPSLVAVQNKSNCHFNCFNRFEMKELSTFQGGIDFVNNFLSSAVDIFSFGYDAHRENMFRLSVAKRLSEQWFSGVAVQYRWMQSELYEEIPQCLSTDIGILYSPVENMFIGVLIMNAPSIYITSRETDNKLFNSYSLQTGFEWKIINSLLIAGTVESNECHHLTGSAGIEYILFKDFSFRTGLQFSSLLPTMGIGYQVSHFIVNAAVVYHQSLGISSGIGISFTF